MTKSSRREPARSRARAPRKPVAPSTNLEDVIRQRAYQISEERGAPGDPVSDWLRAEREIQEREGLG